MDTPTHMLVGALIGQAIGYKKYGRKAIVMGALGGLIPDLDVFLTPIARLFGNHDEFLGWKYHRGFTHSLWFAPLVGSLIGWATWKHYGRQVGEMWPWIAIMILSILAHPILDTCTIYGTQLLAPFSDHRFFISAVSIIDPLYTIPLIIGVLFCAAQKTRPYARRAALIILILTTSYLGFGLHLNSKAKEIGATQLAEQNIQYERIEAYTTIFQPWLRRIVAWQPNNEIRVGFVSTLSPSHIYWTCQKQASVNIQQNALSTKEGAILDWFSVHTLSFLENEQRLTVSDVRYGVPGPSVFGWWGMEFSIQSDKLIYLGRTQGIRDASWAAIKELFKASYGMENTFLPAQDQGCSE